MSTSLMAHTQKNQFEVGAYESRPFPIEAVQVTDENIEDLVKWTDSYGLTIRRRSERSYEGRPFAKYTLEKEGYNLPCNPGDWVFKIDGVVATCENDYFEAKYRKVGTE